MKNNRGLRAHWLWSLALIACVFPACGDEVYRASLDGAAGEVDGKTIEGDADASAVDADGVAVDADAFAGDAKPNESSDGEPGCVHAPSGAKVLDVPADCHATICDGAGHAAGAVVAQSNVPAPDGPCIVGTCDDLGRAGTAPRPAGTGCSAAPKGAVCDGAGKLRGVQPHAGLRARPLLRREPSLWLGAVHGPRLRRSMPAMRPRQALSGRGRLSVCRVRCLERHVHPEPMSRPPAGRQRDGPRLWRRPLRGLRARAGLSLRPGLQVPSVRRDVVEVRFGGLCRSPRRRHGDRRRLRRSVLPQLSGRAEVQVDLRLHAWSRLQRPGAHVPVIDGSP